MPTPSTSPRAAGVLLHVTSLPTAFGTGDLGPAAFAWVDRLSNARIGLWQILPMNLPASGGAPYSACSAFAGNVYLISPERLREDDLIDDAELKSLRRKPSSRVDFTDVRKSRDAMLVGIAERFANRKVAPALLDEFKRFCRAEAGWLEDFALFMALREHHPDVAWNRWPKRLARRDPAALEEVRGVVEPILHRRRVEQFLFYRQLDALRAHARSRGVRILGDVPIYVALDSADVWANPKLFELDARLEPTNVSGVPPDFFSKTGQTWHNPLYDWKALEREGFAWWIARMRAMLRQADVVRLDHFRALSAYWSIPAMAKDARGGKWVDAPGEAFLQAIADAFKGLPLVAEDLGVITDDVVALRKQFGLAGMQVLQFAVGSPMSDEPHVPAWPHTMQRDVIAYTGNHDTDTTAGFWAQLSAKLKRQAIEYAPELATEPTWGLTRMAWQSVADVAVVPAQDLLELGSDARMNKPGTTGDENWSWRMTTMAEIDRPLKRLAGMTKLYARTAAAPPGD